MLEANYRTWCAQNNVILDDSPINEDEIMDDVPLEEPEDMDWNGFGDDDEDLPNFFKEEADRKMKEKIQPGTKRRRKGRVAELVREKTRRVLEEKTDLVGKRARMCDEGDFLKLLWAFNEEDIHFS